MHGLKPIPSPEPCAMSLEPSLLPDDKSTQLEVRLEEETV
jgi:hypothetical protein